MRFRLDPTLFDTASGARAREWRAALADLNADADGLPPTLMVAKRDDGGVDLLVADDDDGVRTADATRIEAPYERLKGHFREYRQIIQQLERAGFGLRDVETLDYAKKLAHDEAAQTLVGLLGSVAQLPHKQARRLFTLVFLVSSELPEHLVTRHRHR